MPKFPSGSLVLHFWAGSNSYLVLTPAGLRKFFLHTVADEVRDYMVGRKQVFVHGGENIMPLSMVAQHGVLCDKDMLFITADGTIVTGPAYWGHA